MSNRIRCFSKGGHKMDKDNKGKKSEKDERLSKRLCYVLRYGAVKERLTLYEGGNVIIIKNSIHRLKHGRKHTKGQKIFYIEL